MPFIRHFTACIIIFWTACIASGQASIPAPKEPARAIEEALVIVGGGTIPDAIADEFARLAGGSKARLVVMPIAGADADKAKRDELIGIWKKRGIDSIGVFRVNSRQGADNPEFLSPLRAATAVWLDGGDQIKLAEVYHGTAVEAELKKLLGRGGVIGGTSAGAAVMSRLMIAGGDVPAKLGQGFDLLPNIIIDKHVLKRDSMDRLLETLSRNPGWAGLGIDEQTAVIAKGRTLKVVGSSYAIVCLAAGAGRPASCQVLKSGDRTDLIAVTRAALERTRAQHPPVRLPVAGLSKGALIIGGGGGLGDDIWNRFLDLAGGANAKIVVIPTALDFPTKGEPGEARRLKKLGALNVKVLHATNHAEAEAVDFVGSLNEASGVWFCGGRQWRLVDSYLDTAAEKAFHNLLARGGIIAGSSAGASIQADYMVRGDPLGNLKMMVEGYERGFGFLKGVAIDQHFFKRKRTADMSTVMARYPQLLGIGIDEGTALLVQGETMSVMGISNVAVYDSTKKQGGESDYEILRPGSVYNLRTRSLVESK